MTAFAELDAQNPSAQSASPWRNVQPIDGPYARRIDAAHSGLVSPVLHKTARAWKVQTRAGEPTWLPESQVQHQGQDGWKPVILVLPA